MAMIDVFEGDVSGLRGSVVLYFPGWATDHRVFGELPRTEGETTAGYIQHADPQDLPRLIALIAKSPATWHLVGFSLGGFMAHDVARRVPEKVASLTLIGIREQYSVGVCRAMQRHLRQDKQQVLEDFWEKAFGTMAAVPFLVEDYDTDMLSRGLAYLAQYSWDACPFSFPVTCCHGEADAIAPLSEAQALAQRKGWPLHIRPGMGHIWRDFFFI